jgi:hypothetical protein
MATRASVEWIDDYDGESEAVATVEFSFEGVDYEIDLCADNLEKLRALLRPWIEKACVAEPFDDEEETGEASVVELVRWTNRDIVFPKDSAGTPFGSRFTPGVAVHRGEMWCLFVRKSDNRLYFGSGNQAGWRPPRLFSADPELTVVNSPQLAELDGVLHAVFVESGRGGCDLVHYRYDDANREWVNRSGLVQRTRLSPALAAHRGRLFCVYVAEADHDRLMFTTWDAYRGWSRPVRYADETSWGAPALFVVGDELHLVFAAADDDRAVIDMIYREPDGTAPGTWVLGRHQTYVTANAGVAATGSATNGYLSFLRRDVGSLLLSTLGPDGWSENEFPGGYAWEAPAVVVQGGRINLIFNARNDGSDLLWHERPLLPSESQG